MRRVLGTKLSDIASNTLMSDKTVQQYVERFQQTGSMAPCVRKDGPVRILSEFDEAILVQATPNKNLCASLPCHSGRDHLTWYVKSWLYRSFTGIPADRVSSMLSASTHLLQRENYWSCWLPNSYCQILDEDGCWQWERFSWGEYWWGLIGGHS